MSNDIKKVIVVVPHRISGFFEIVDQINGVNIDNPERIGSRGAGFNVSAVGKTVVVLERIGEEEIPERSIFINGEKLDEKAETTYYILKHVEKHVSKPIKIKIFHTFDLPVGCGYGASGSGALGAIFGLNSLLKLNLNKKESGRIAHIAEVVNKTGLGTVCGQLGGGLCMLKEPGYPCVHERIEFPDDLKTICGTLGMIHTKSILTDPVLSSKIKKAGRSALNKLISDPCVKTFVKASIEFVKETDMLNILNLTKIKELMESLNKLKIIGASMNQLGRSVYAMCRKKNEKEVIDVFNSFKPEIKIHHLSINQNSLQIFNKS